MTKSQLRTKYKNLRYNLSSDRIASLSIQIANKSLKLPIWSFQYYHLFLTIENKKEIDTSFLLSILQGKDKEVIVPITDFSKQTLEHILLTDSTRLKISNFGIPEPKNGISVPVDKIQVVFVPLLAFDKNGNRVGYGKGFYDRFLRECNDSCLKIGLSFFEPEEIIEEIDEYDVKLDYCITPHYNYRFN